MKTTFKTWLPVFTGFYNTIFDPSDHWLEMEMECEREEFNDRWFKIPDNVTVDEAFEEVHLCIDYAPAYLELAQVIVDGVQELFDDNIKELGVKFKFEELRSPKEYNFANDAINVEVEVDTCKIKQLLNDDEELENFVINEIRKRYTSRSGFFSSHPSNYEEFMEDAFDGASRHRVGALLDMIIDYKIDNDDGTQWELYNNLDYKISESFNPEIDVEKWEGRVS